MRVEDIILDWSYMCAKDEMSCELEGKPFGGLIVVRCEMLKKPSLIEQLKRTLRQT